MTSQKSKFKLVASIALLVVALDLLTKWFIVKYIPFGGEIIVVPGYFDIVHVRNTGAAFGFLSSWDSPLRDIFFYIIGIVAFAMLYRYIATTPVSEKLSLTALALVTGGAIGNLTDRAWRGSVVDFLSVHYQNKIWEFSALGKVMSFPLYWPAFNVAESCICVGVTLLLWQSLKNPNK